MDINATPLDVLEDDFIKQEVIKIGLEYDADIWSLSANVSSAADAAIVFNWPIILKPLIEYPGSEGYCHILRSVAACLLVGIGARRYAPNTTMTTIIMVRHFLTLLLDSNHTRLSLVTPGQINAVMQQYRINSRSGLPNAASTLTGRMNSIGQLFRLKRYTGDGLNFEPFPDRHRRRLSRGLKQSGFWEAPPEPVCMHLLRRSIEIVENLSVDVIRILNRYSSAAQNAVDSGAKTKDSISPRALAAIGAEIFTSAGSVKEVMNYDASNTTHVAFLRKQLLTACFIVITYTCGTRVSEIRRATSNSLRTIEHPGGRPYDYFFAPRSKRRFTSRINVSGGEGDEFPWVLSPAATNAFRVLIDVSRPFRHRSGIDSLWLTYTGSSLWAFRPKHPPGVLTNGQFNNRLNAFAEFIGLKENTGWSGRLHSHMGRKFLARFVGKRDRTYLGDLAIQFSHTTAESVDYSYVQPDEDFRQVVQEQVSGEINAVTDLLANSSTNNVFFGARGTERAEQLANFIGQCRTKHEVKSLLAKGARLVPCQWGVCIYRQETSACTGSKQGPNPMKRAPEICTDCTNFLATPRHAQWWIEYAADSARILKQKTISNQMKIIINDRLKTAQNILQSILGDL